MKATRPIRSDSKPPVWPPSFTKPQLKLLKEEGLFEEQIEELQRMLPRLPLLAWPALPIGPVRERLKHLENNLAAVLVAIDEIQDPGRLIRNVPAGEKPSPEVRAMLETYSRVMGDGSDPMLFRAAVSGIKPLLRATVNARIKLPKQRRRRAPSEAIRAIDGRLQVGHLRHFAPGWPHVPGESPPPEFTMRASLGGRFQRVAQICFDAIGSKADTERAIKQCRADK
jgi:hypothetical protein